MELDPFLYVALVAGWAAGRLTTRRPVWVAKAALGSVAVLLVLLGASIAALSPVTLLVVAPFAGLLAAVSMTTAAVVAILLRRRGPGRIAVGPPRAEARLQVPTSVLLVLALLAGFGVGREFSLPSGTLIPWALYALLLLVGFGLDLRWEPLRRAWVPLLGAGVGAMVAWAVVATLLPGSSSAVLASSLAFGWYSLAGPLVAAKAGAELGWFALLANLLRESATMVAAPRLGRRIGAEGLTAMGGATSMDTTLLFVLRYGDADAGALAIASGLILTAAASVLVPLALAL